MARIKLGIILQSIAGSIGEFTYACWKGVNYIRTKATSISNPNSTPQSQMRARMSAAAKRWFDVLIGPQRDGWEEYAQQQGSASESKGPNSTGGSGQKVVIPSNNAVMSGFNAYVMHQCLLYSAGIKSSGEWYDDAPLHLSPPNAPTNLHCVLAPPACPTLAWVDPLEYGPTDRIRLWLRCSPAGIHRQLVATVAVGEQAYTPGQVRVALGHLKSVGFLPGIYNWQADCVASAGKSAPSNVAQCEYVFECTTPP